MGGTAEPTVTVGIPVLDEGRYIDRCLDAIESQTYGRIIEVLVVDGGSSDDTAERAARRRLVRVLHNERRTRPAGLNVALAHATGEVFVRVDARTLIAEDYVERSVAALEASGAAIVGGPMRLTASTPAERGIRAAMESKLGGGTASFRREGGAPRFVDTVYLGAFRLDKVRDLGGYDEWFGGNEDAELNHRAHTAGGVWLDPSIASSYAVRSSLRALSGQYRRYGRAWARTMRKHPSSIAFRQLAIPLFFLGLLSPWRRRVAATYAAGVLALGATEARADRAASPWVMAALPVMHASWALGFVEGMLTGPAASAPLAAGDRS